jgi:hypothetical protein
MSSIRGWRHVLLAGLITALLSPAVAVIAQESSQPAVAILGLERSDVTAGEARLVANRVSARMTASDSYRVVDPSVRDAVAEELEFSLSGMVDRQQQLEAGRMLAADYIVTGAMGTLGDRCSLSLRLLRVETGETVREISRLYQSFDELVDDVIAATEELLDLPPARSDARIAERTKENLEPSADRPPLAASGSFLEVGTVLFGSDAGAILDAAWPGLTVGYSYQFRRDLAEIEGNRLGLGVCAGVSDEPGDRNTELRPFWLYGVRVSFGDKANGVAFALNAGVPPSIGFYFNGWYVNAALFPWPSDIGLKTLASIDIGRAAWLGKIR